MPAFETFDLSSGPAEHRNPPGPYPAAPVLVDDLCDPRLAQFELYHWLQTPVSTAFAARAISFYLTTNHPIVGLFDADLFLSDLVAHRTEFCSPLLLSSILSSACVRRTHTGPPPLLSLGACPFSLNNAPPLVLSLALPSHYQVSTKSLSSLHQVSTKTLPSPTKSCCL